MSLRRYRHRNVLSTKVERRMQNRYESLGRTRCITSDLIVAVSVWLKPIDKEIHYYQTSLDISSFWIIDTSGGLPYMILPASGSPTAYGPMAFLLISIPSFLIRKSAFLTLKISPIRPSSETGIARKKPTARSGAPALRVSALI